jgi:dihydrofolate reductase
MRTLTVFNQVSLDGYFTDKNNSIDWAKGNIDDPEWQKYVAGNATGGGVLLFGRKTYDMMKSYWPTEQARKDNAKVAEAMNALPKIVFSRSLDRVDWKNTTLAKGELVDDVRRMKGESGPEMVILGSGSIVAQLAPTGLIDSYTIIVNPTVLGNGRTMFEGVESPIRLETTSVRKFRNGNTVVTYDADTNPASATEPAQRSQTTQQKKANAKR